MKICNRFNYKGALEILEKQESIFQELEQIVNNDLQFGRDKPAKIKKYVAEKFNKMGWGDKIKVANSKLTINFKKSGVGVCFQLGNVARTYADLLKLMELYSRNSIEVGAIYVAHSIEAKKMGTNYAQYQRLVGELELFRDIITIPIYVIGLSN